MNDDQDNLDLELRDHFAKKLDGQLGRASAAFTRSTRWNPWRIVAVAGGLAAAIVLIVIGAKWNLSVHQSPPPQMAQRINPLVRQEQAMNVEYSIAWERTDEGTVFLNNEPLRGIRTQRVETLKWTDPESNARIELRMPREEVDYVALSTN